MFILVISGGMSGANPMLALIKSRCCSRSLSNKDISPSVGIRALERIPRSVVFPAPFSQEGLRPPP